MHNAPSVVFPVGRCAFQGWLLVVLGMVGAAVGALFLVESDFWRLGAWGWLPGVTGMCVWLIWAAWAFANWRRSPQGSLRWDARQLADSGAIVLKFWLAVTPDVQLERFQEREASPFKNFKITPDDWRNREKWQPYADAANEMMARTDSGHAPWHLISANDKRHARLQVLRHVVQALESQL